MSFWIVINDRSWIDYHKSKAVEFGNLKTVVELNESFYIFSHYNVKYLHVQLDYETYNDIYGNLCKVNISKQRTEV